MAYNDSVGTTSIDIEPVAPVPVSNDDLILIAGVGAAVAIGLAVFLVSGKGRRH